MFLRNTGVYILGCALLLLVGVSTTHGAVRQTKNTETASSTKYSIPIPVLFGVSLSDIVPNFGEPRGGGTRTHEGLDIMAEEGAPIVSPVKGTVLRYGSADTPGKYVYIRGSDGHVYAFMHLDEIAKLKRNQKIAVGDLVGTVGETGNAKGTTPHLHFEIRKNKPIDPFIRIQKEFTLKEKIAYLNKALSKVKRDDTLIHFMVNSYRGILMKAEKQGVKLDPRITKALQKTPLPSVASTTLGLRVGSEGKDVVTLQHLLIVLGDGPHATQLEAAGATGYFGRTTEAALREYQKTYGIVETGVFDFSTRMSMYAIQDLH